MVRLPGSSLARELGGIQSRDVDCSGHKAQQDWSFLGFFVWLANFFFFGFLTSKRGVLGVCMHCLIHSWGFDSFVRICFLPLHSLLPFLPFEPRVSRASVIRPAADLLTFCNQKPSQIFQSLIHAIACDNDITLSRKGGMHFPCAFSSLAHFTSRTEPLAKPKTLSPAIATSPRSLSGTAFGIVACGQCLLSFFASALTHDVTTRKQLLAETDLFSRIGLYLDFLTRLISARIDRFPTERTQLDSTKLEYIYIYIYYGQITDARQKQRGRLALPSSHRTRLRRFLG